MQKINLLLQPALVLKPLFEEIFAMKTTKISAMTLKNSY